jgi:HAD superfamily hydrolase (TIGR01549 family)
MKDVIKHVWFDLEETLTRKSRESIDAHDSFLFEAFSEVTGKPLDENLKSQYRDLYKKYGSNSAVFRALGKPASFWQERISHAPIPSYDESVQVVPEVLRQLKERVPISLFSNAQIVHVERSLRAIGVSREWFTHILTGEHVPERKPRLDGFDEMAKRSKLLPKNILYVGDRVETDIVPAKKVGMQTALAWGTSEVADYSFPNFVEILELFRA